MQTKLYRCSIPVKNVFQTHSWKSTSLLLVVVRATPGSPHIHKENDKFKSQIPMV